MNEGNFWSEGWVRSSLHRAHCRCFRRCPACAMCDGIARHGTAACGATREKKRGGMMEDGCEIYWNKRQMWEHAGLHSVCDS